MCNEMAKEKTNWRSETMRRNFESGVCLGWGFMNQLFSHLPARVLKVISLMGISADRQLAIQQFHKGIDQLSDTLRSKLCRFVYCFYNFYFEQFFGD